MKMKITNKTKNAINAEKESPNSIILFFCREAKGLPFLTRK